MPPPPLKQSAWSKFKTAYNNAQLSASKSIDQIFKQGNNYINSKPELLNFQEKTVEQLTKMNTALNNRVNRKASMDENVTKYDKLI